MDRIVFSFNVTCSHKYFYPLHATWSLFYKTFPNFFSCFWTLICWNLCFPENSSAFSKSILLIHHRNFSENSVLKSLISLEETLPIILVRKYRQLCVNSPISYLHTNEIISTFSPFQVRDYPCVQPVSVSNDYFARVISLSLLSLWICLYK